MSTVYMSGYESSLYVRLDHLFFSNSLESGVNFPSSILSYKILQYMGQGRITFRNILQSTLIENFEG